MGVHRRTRSAAGARRAHDLRMRRRAPRCVRLGAADRVHDRPRDRRIGHAAARRVGRRQAACAEPDLRRARPGGARGHRHLRAGPLHRRADPIPARRLGRPTDDHRQHRAGDTGRRRDGRVRSGRAGERTTGRAAHGGIAVPGVGRGSRRRPGAPRRARGISRPTGHGLERRAPARGAERARQTDRRAFDLQPGVVRRGRTGPARAGPCRGTGARCDTAHRTQPRTAPGRLPDRARRRRAGACRCDRRAQPGHRARAHRGPRAVDQRLDHGRFRHRRGHPGGLREVQRVPRREA